MMRSTSGCAWMATASKPPCSPGMTNEGFSDGERLHVGLRAHVLVVVEQRQAVDVLDRGDRALEPALVPGGRRALLRLDGVGVDVVAREAVFGGDEVGGDALRHEIGGDRERRIGRPRAAGRADADAAHRFDAAADRQVVLAAHHLRRGEIHRIEARGAEAVDLHARHRVAEARGQRAHAGDVAAGLADRIDAAHDDVVDLGRFELVAVLDRLQRGRGELQRRGGVQRPVRLAAAARRAHVIENEGVGHAVSPCGAFGRVECLGFVIGMLIAVPTRARGSDRHGRCRAAGSAATRRARRRAIRRRTASSARRPSAGRGCRA